VASALKRLNLTGVEVSQLFLLFGHRRLGNGQQLVDAVRVLLRQLAQRRVNPGVLVNYSLGGI
jgi:hypothetical protein